MFHKVYILAAFLRFLHILPTFAYRPTQNIFLIPGDAVDQQKLGFQICIFYSSVRLHLNTYIVILNFVFSLPSFARLHDFWPLNSIRCLKST